MAQWSQSKGFNAWLDTENLGNDEYPLDEDTLDLMYRAWVAVSEKMADALGLCRMDGCSKVVCAPKHTHCFRHIPTPGSRS